MRTTCPNLKTPLDSTKRNAQRSLELLRAEDIFCRDLANISRIEETGSITILSQRAANKAHHYQGYKRAKSSTPYLYAQSRLGHLYSTLATADHTYSTRDFMPHVLLSHLNISFYLYLLHIYINIKVSALDWQSLPERFCSRTPASTVLYRTGHSVMNYSFAVVLCVSESVKDISRLHACLQDSSLFPHFLITTWPSTTADYGYPS
ncbi:hypothetical protein J6590_082837 [Homalodisca vitripennis]|nr:hypothetical protein J6590_082837 [Homalodisca vitripennis]